MVRKKGSAKNPVTTNTTVTRTQRKIKARVKNKGTAPVNITVGKVKSFNNPDRRRLLDYARKEGIQLPGGYETAKGFPRTLSGIHSTRITQELKHQHNLETGLNKLKEFLKNKKLSASDKASTKREIAKFKKSIMDSRKSITSMKKYL